MDNFEKLFEEASGWSNGHDFYAIVNVESADALFSFMFENIKNHEQFSDAKVEGNVVTFHGTGDRYYYEGEHCFDALEMISKKFPEAVCYYNDCWDEPLWFNCFAGNKTDCYNLSLSSISAGGDEDAYDIEITVTDKKTGYQFCIGGGSISYDEIVDYANSQKPDKIGYQIIAELHKLTCGLTDASEVFLQYIYDEYQLEFGAKKLVADIVGWVWQQSMDKEDTVKTLAALLYSIDITEEEISIFINWD